MDSQTRHFIETIFTETGFTTTTRKIDKYNQTISRTRTKSVQEGNKMIKVTQKIGLNNKVLSTTLQPIANGTNDFVNAMRRALIVAPVWLAIRAAMMQVFSAIKNIKEEYKALDEGMRKVMAVATFTGDTQKKVYADLETQARRYFATSNAGMKDITEAMYQLGTAGLSTEQIMEGFEHVMNLSIGTFGDVVTSGRLMAGIFNVFGDELKEVGDTSEQMQYVADLLTTAWKNNQIELSELNTAMGHLAASGKVVGLGLKELVATASVMSDALLRGGKGGRLLARGFVQLAKEGKKLEKLGVYFDPTKPLDFHDVMGQLHVIYEKQGKSLVFLNELVDIFGARGIKAVGGVLELFEKFNEEVSRTPEIIKGASEEAAKSAQDTFGGITSRVWHNIISSRGTPSGESPFKDALKSLFRFERVEEMTATLNNISTIFKVMGKDIVKTKDEARLLADQVRILGDPNLSRQIQKTFGISIFENLLSTGLLEVEHKKVLDGVIARYDALVKSKEKLEKPTPEKALIGISPDKPLDREVVKLKEGLKYRILSLQKVSETSITMTKIVDLIEKSNKAAKALGKENITIADVLSLNKEKIQGITHFYEDLLKLGVKAVLNAEKERLQIQDLLIKSQLDQLKSQGATHQQLISSKILFEDALGQERAIVEATKNELDLRKAITNEKEIDLKLSSQTLKLAEVANNQGIDVAKELGDLLQGRVKFAEFERNAMDETWAALAKNFPNIIKQQRALQLLVEGVDPSGRVVTGATDIAIKEEALRRRGENELLMLNELKLQSTRKEKDIQNQIDSLEKQNQLLEESKKQTEILKESSKKSLAPEVNIYFKDTPVSKEDFVVEIKTDGSTIANALDERNEK